MMSQKGKCKRDEPEFHTTPYGLYADMSDCSDKFELNVSFNSNDWELVEIVVKTPAEHSVYKNGKKYYYPGEIQMGYRGTGGSSDEILILSVFLKEGDDEHDKDWELEKYINQWESYQEHAYKNCNRYFNVQKCLALADHKDDDKCDYCEQHCSSSSSSSSSKWTSSDSKWKPSDSDSKWKPSDSDSKWKSSDSDSKWTSSDSKWKSSDSDSDNKWTSSDSDKWTSSDHKKSSKKSDWRGRQLRVKPKNEKMIVKPINGGVFSDKKQQQLEMLVWEQQQELRRLKRQSANTNVNATDMYVDVAMDTYENATQTSSRILGDSSSSSTYNVRCHSDSAYCPPNLYKHTETKYYYRYKGSLTVPPCSEIVDWRVMMKPLTVSPEQLTMLRTLQTRHIYDKHDQSVPPQLRCKSVTVGKTIDDHKHHDSEMCEIGVNRPRQSMTKHHDLQKCSRFTNHQNNNYL
jgi:hypothetical protein